MNRSRTALAAPLFLVLSTQPQAQSQSQTQGVPMSAAASAPAAATSHVQVVRRYFEQVIDQHNSDIIPELFTPNVITHSGTGDGTSIEDVRRSIQNVHRLFPEHHFTIEDVFESGDKVVVRWSMTAMNTAPIAGVPPTGHKITNSAIVIYRFEGDKIAEYWAQIDQVNVLRQIGVQLPGQPPAAAQPARPGQQ